MPVKALGRRELNALLSPAGLDLEQWLQIGYPAKPIASPGGVWLPPPSG